jgi:hypothetical protein
LVKVLAGFGFVIICMLGTVNILLFIEPMEDKMIKFYRLRTKEKTESYVLVIRGNRHKIFIIWNGFRTDSFFALTSSSHVNKLGGGEKPVGKKPGKDVTNTMRLTLYHFHHILKKKEQEKRYGKY